MIYGIKIYISQSCPQGLVLNLSFVCVCLLEMYPQFSQILQAIQYFQTTGYPQTCLKPINSEQRLCVQCGFV